MKDEEKAARFGSDLDAFLADKTPAPGADQEALSLAKRLAGLDQSAESRVRASLRARLLSPKPRRGFR